MSGWVPFDAAWWPEVAGALPQPWPEGAALFDLRWHADRNQERKVPHGKRFWMRRWGWTDWGVRALLRSGDWRDTIHPLPAQDPPADHPPTTRRPPADERLRADNGADSTRSPPAHHPLPAQDPPADHHRRGDPQPPSHSQPPSQEDTPPPPAERGASPERTKRTKPAADRPAPEKKPKVRRSQRDSGVPTPWLRHFSDAWAAVYAESGRSAKYPWKLPGPDAASLREAATAVGCNEDVDPSTPDEAALKRFSEAAAIYIEAADNREAFPFGEPPSIFHFARSIATWVQRADENAEVPACDTQQDYRLDFSGEESLADRWLREHGRLHESRRSVSLDELAAEVSDG